MAFLERKTKRTIKGAPAKTSSPMEKASAWKNSSYAEKATPLTKKAYAEKATPRVRQSGTNKKVTSARDAYGAAIAAVNRRKRYR
jgi:hypothetical protein